MFLGGEYAWLISHQQAINKHLGLCASRQRPAASRTQWEVVDLLRIIGYGAAHPWVKESAILLSRQNLEFHWHPRGFWLQSHTGAAAVGNLYDAWTVLLMHLLYIPLSPNSWRDGRKPPELLAPATTRGDVLKLHQ